MGYIHDIPTFLNGHQVLAREVIKIADLVVKHFKPFDGKRAFVQAGRSAAFEKVVQAFYRDYEQVKQESGRAIVSSGIGTYTWLNIDVHTPDPGKSSRSYYKQNYIIGEDVHDGDDGALVLHYAAEPWAWVRECRTILDIVPEGLEAERDRYIHQLKLAEDIKRSTRIPLVLCGIFDQ